MAKYKVLIPVTSDKLKKRFEPGDTVSDETFPKSVIKNWLEIDVLEKPEPVEKNDDSGDNEIDKFKDGD